MKKLFLLFCIITHIMNSQCIQPVNFQHQKDLPMPFPSIQLNLTAHRDTSSSKPFLYICAKGGGLQVYNISSITNPTLVSTVGIALLQNLHVMSCTQEGNYLYLALGDFFSASAQKSGMAIVNISNPASPVVTSTYTFNATGGAGHVAVEGNYAFLSAMQNGIIVLDISNKTSISFVSQFKPSIHYPKPNPNASEQLKINARQIVAKNSILYLCYDAGGVRIINASNKSSLKETGKYSNPMLLNRARAYNNLVLNDSLVYVAADYCGLEIVKIKDTSNIIQVGWWNPWKCETSSNTWFNSTGHTNEIEFDASCRMVFMSGGRSDVLAVNVSNPSLPDSCSRYGIPGDSLAAWGIGKYKNQLYVSYIFATVPFYANWGGTKILTYNNNCSIGITELSDIRNNWIYPNPATNEILFKYLPVGTDIDYKIINSIGADCLSGKANSMVTIESLIPGLYTVFITIKGQTHRFKFIKE